MPANDLLAGYLLEGTQIGPLASGKYVMSLTHLRLACTMGGWSSMRLGAQRSLCEESVVRGLRA